MKYYLISYITNWADEIDIKCYSIMTEYEKDEFIEAFKKQFEEYDEYVQAIGSNQVIIYDYFKDFMDCIKSKEITKVQYLEFNNIFGYTEIGFFPEIYCDGV